MSPGIQTEFAPAKVNLYLHVGALGEDGFHPLETLMAFADVGDTLTLSAGAEAALELSGPFAGGLVDADNLVVRAAELLATRCGRADARAAFLLDKQLPVAAGLGGGSADAAATLRLLDRAWDTHLGEVALEALAAELGSDVPACVGSRPVTARGRGEVLRPAPRLPALPAVLVNPGVACPTGAVYRAFDQTGPGPTPSPAPDPGNLPDATAAARWLSGLANDLEAPAIAVAPVISTVLERLRAASGTLLGRLSGSGATCFALCADDAAARRMAADLSRAHPGWWVRACRLGAPLQPTV